MVVFPGMGYPECEELVVARGNQISFKYSPVGISLKRVRPFVTGAILRGESRREDKRYFNDRRQYLCPAVGALQMFHPKSLE